MLIITTLVFLVRFAGLAPSQANTSPMTMFMQSMTHVAYKLFLVSRSMEPLLQSGNMVLLSHGGLQHSLPLEESWPAQRSGRIGVNIVPLCAHRMDQTRDGSQKRVYTGLEVEVRWQVYLGIVLFNLTWSLWCFFRFQISFVKLCSIEETQVKHKLVQFEETFLSISFAVGDSIRVMFSVSILF